ncbi:protein gp8 [Bacillus methanolicus PB1]|uniref:Protein gp8 n=1 Tax=Bacillus methanolicus PB1 TaxID=997296 RepID=I3DXZ4_BACMT|nr:hypothetical protein [Bacillus methanolicus]EIJ79115.1 protein gp8 [Bacillus methanolicus PB1]
MAYIDKQYYDNNYNGVPIADESTFNRLAERASDVIDQMTGYLLHGQEFTQFVQFIQEQVKKATAAQIEYMVTAGGEVAVHGGGSFSSVNIGNFSYSEGEGAKNLSRNEQRTSPAVIGYLRPTGLLYRGVNVP